MVIKRSLSYPTLRTYSNTNTPPVYGSGTVTDTYGGMWNYTGTVTGMVTATTTTTITVQENPARSIGAGGVCFYDVRTRFSDES
jgi:hypothetical protein